MIPPPMFAACYTPVRGQEAGGFAEVSALLTRALAAGVPPTISAVVITSVAGVSYAAAGGSVSLPGEPPDPVEVTGDVAFDLASLTKVIATVPMALVLHQRGAWSLDDPVRRWLRGAPRSRESPVTIRQCLTHTAGLVPHRPFYECCGDADAVREAVLGELAGAGGGPVTYSDLGYMLVGWAIEECAAESLDVFAGREIFGPLEMASASFRAEVHDGNARALGGVSGHAGLFSTADDLGKYAVALLRPRSHPVLSEASIELMTSRQAASGEDVRALGWRLSPSGWGSWPEGTIWHAGFTGTSLLVAPSLGVGVVLLAGGAGPETRLAEIRELRARFHRLVRAAL